MQITQSSEVKKLFAELLVTRNKLASIKKFYTELKADLLSDLQGTYDSLGANISWMEEQLLKIDALYSELTTVEWAFTANTSPDSAIVNHPKYLELMSLYNEYVQAFYERMTELVTTYSEDFVNNKLSDVNSNWTFHYGDNYSDATPVKHTWGSVNVNGDSEIMEVSSGRYILHSKENLIYDYDYKNKDCYVIDLDGKTLFNQYTFLSGSLKGYLANESAKLLKIFQAPGKAAIYALIDMGYVSSDTSITCDIVGVADDGLTHMLVVAKYDLDTHAFTICSDEENTSTIYIKDKIVRENDVVFLQQAYSDYVYFYADTYLMRVKVEGASSSDLAQTKVLESTDPIRACVIADTKYLVVTMEETILSVFDLSTTVVVESPVRALNTSSLSSLLSAGEKGIIYAFFMCDSGIYFTTDKSLWYTTDLFATVAKDVRSSNIAVTDLSFSDTSIYVMDTNSYFYYLNNNKYVCCLKPDNTTVMSPTRYADKLFFIKNDTDLSLAGYVYSRLAALTGSESVIYSFVSGDTYCGITSTGKIVLCDILSGTFKTTKVSVVSGKTCTAFDRNADGDILYIGTIDSNLYKISIADLLSVSDVSATLIVNAGMGGIYSIYEHLDILYIGGYIGRVSAYDLSKSALILYNAEDSGYCVDAGSAIGLVNVRAITSDSNNLVIMGNGGRVASCNFTSKLWTKYDGSGVNSTTVDSPIFNDGSAIGNSDIICALNYINKYVVVFGSNGRVASFNIATGYWTMYNGADGSVKGKGPGIYDAGAAVANKSIRSAMFYGTSIVYGTDGGCMASINALTGGVTRYDGINVSSDILGPGIFSDGAIFGSKAILTIANDSVRGDIVYAGESGYISSYNVLDAENLVPNISKLYYIGRRNSANDYLSSLLIQLSTETLRESKAMYPPRQKDDTYTDAYNSAYYVYKNGDFIYRLSSDLETLYRSADDGITYTVHSILNKNWSTAITASTIRKVKGFVSKDGSFGFYASVNGTNKFLFTRSEGGVISASWYDNPAFADESNIEDFGIISGSKGVHLFFVKLSSALTTQHPVVPKLIRFASTAGYIEFSSVLEQASTEADKLWKFAVNSKDEIISSTLGSNLNVVKWNFTTHGLSFDLSADVPYERIFSDLAFSTSNAVFFKKYFAYHGLLKYLTEEVDTLPSMVTILTSPAISYRPMGFYMIGENVFNYVFGGRDGTVLILTISKSRSTSIKVTQSADLADYAGWNVSHAIVPVTQYMDIFGRNRYTDKTGESAFKVTDMTFEYLEAFENGEQGLLGFNVSYWENFSEIDSGKAGYRTDHVIVSLDCEKYAGFVEPRYRVFKVIPGCGEKITADETNQTVVVAGYTREISDGSIKWVNSIHKFDCIKSVKNSPVRSLTDAWFRSKIRMTNDIDAFKIRCKVRHLDCDSPTAVVDKQFAIRYEVLISDESTGKFVLYEVEKSTVSGRTNPETGTAEPVFRVKALDGFSDEIVELFTSRLSERQTAFTKTPSVSSSYPTGYSPVALISEDFMTYVQLNRSFKTDASNSAYRSYNVSIRPSSTLPSSVDVSFYIEPYKTGASNDRSTRTEPVVGRLNNINRSEYILSTALSGFTTDYIFGVPGSSGFIKRTVTDMVHFAKHLHETNHLSLPAYDSSPLYEEVGYADTHCVYFSGKGNGLYDKMVGIVTHVGKGKWKLVPYNFNRKEVKYSFDESGSSLIKKLTDLPFAKAGRNLHKMNVFGIYGRGVLNNADYYVDYASDGRVARSEGFVTTPYGVLESISTLNGSQKRVVDVVETNESLVYRNAVHGLDSIKERKYGFGYDIVDRFSISELPYYYIQAWWIPAKGFITRSNESLLTFDYNESESAYKCIGRNSLPFDNIAAPSILSTVLEEGEGGGIGSSGTLFDTNRVAFSTLLDEKYPLEHWSGFNDLDFVRKWKDTYVDRTDHIRYEVEKPKAETTLLTTIETNPTVISASDPTVPRNLYHYDDDFDWERRGTQNFKYMTGYYYDAHNWKIYYHEHRKAVYDLSASRVHMMSEYKTKRSLPLVLLGPEQLVNGAEYTFVGGIKVYIPDELLSLNSGNRLREVTFSFKVIYTGFYTGWNTSTDTQTGLLEAEALELTNKVSVACLAAMLSDPVVTSAYDIVADDELSSASISGDVYARYIYLTNKYAYRKTVESEITTMFRSYTRLGVLELGVPISYGEDYGSTFVVGRGAQNVGTLTESIAYSDPVDYMDYNASELKSDTFTEQLWYVPETNNHNNSQYSAAYPRVYTVKPAGTDAWPRGKAEVVGEKITTITTPVPDIVVEAESSACYPKYDGTGLQYSPSPEKIKITRRGKILLNTVNSAWHGYLLVIYNPVTYSVVSANSYYTWGSQASMDSLVAALNGIDTGLIVIIVGSTVCSCTPELRAALASCGGSVTGTWDTTLSNFSEADRSFVFMGVKGSTGGSQIEYLGPVNAYGYDSNLGLIMPYKSGGGFVYAGGWDNAIVGASICYRGNCSTYNRSLTPTITAGAKIYDRYSGGDQRRWMYGQEQTVRFDVTGMTPKSFSRLYYRYTSEDPSGANYGPSSYIHGNITYWDEETNPPSNSPTSDVVDKQFLSASTPTDAVKTRTYTFRTFRNNGTYATTTETYSYIHRWYVINDVVTFTDATQADIANYVVSGTEYYQWADGAVLAVPRNHKFSELAGWNITYTNALAFSNDGTNYNKTHTFVFRGPSLLASPYDATVQTKTITKTQIAKYAASRDDVGVAGVDAIKWQNPTGL